MAKIEVLSKQVYNKISAGEVVEKPASIIKELVENSLDAGAKNIIIEIRKGGIEYISVADDGCGIDATDVELAFLPHATSKIREFEDLSRLTSMGFRGEALASISAVSKVEIVTKTERQELGIKAFLEGGELITKSEVATVNGTKLIIKDLFYNTPARAKFLRKPKSEEGDITTYVEKLMLSHTNVNFKYIVDDEIKYNTTNCDIIDVIYAIYGKDVANNLIEVNYISGDYKVEGYISKPTVAKNNRTYQSLFVNKRYCTNALISASISKAYEGYLMKGKFPLYVLFLTMPQNSLDVNVHPNKLEVKFENSSHIFMLFNNAVSKALFSDSHIKLASEEETFNKTESFNLQTLQKDEGVSFVLPKNEEVEYTKTSIKPVAEENLIFDTQNNNNLFEYKPFVFERSRPEVVEINTQVTQNGQISIQEEIKNNEAETKNSYENLFRPERKVVGVAFKTYIIVEEQDKLYFIDQHAAHERQLFDKFQKQINENEVIKQDLLVPYILNVSEQEAYFIDDNLTLLNEYGFDIVDFGQNSYKITAIPLLLSEIDLSQYFNELLSNLNSIAKKPIDVIRNDIATMACKAAIKGGNKLSDKEINILLDTLEKEKTTLLCPHGRPIVVVYDKKQLEKMFKRIV